MFSAKTTQTSPGWLEKLKLRYKQEPLEAVVGYPRGKEGVGSPHYENGASILQVAIWNNYGTENIPRRAFMDLASAQMQPKFKQMMKDAIKRINAGELELKTVLKAAAAMGQAEVQKAIVDGDWVENSPETIIRKGKGKSPLTDTGDLGRSVTSDVRARTT